MSVKVARLEVGLKVGFDGLRGAVPAKIQSWYWDGYTNKKLYLRLEVVGPEEAQLVLPGETVYRPGMVFDAAADKCAPRCNFQWRDHVLWWTPVEWKEKEEG